MALLDTYRIKKAMSALLSSENLTSEQMTQAIFDLTQRGRRAIPRLIVALAQPGGSAKLTDMLTMLLCDDTLPLFVDGLAHADPVVVSGVSKVLGCGTTYDPNRLLDLFADARIPKTTLGQILSSHTHRLQPKGLVALLDTVGKEASSAVCKLIREAATHDMLPEIIRATQHPEWNIRLHMARVLARFSTPEVRDALLHLLTDAQKQVRQAALDSLACLDIQFDVRPVCAMLRDPDLLVQQKAIEALIKINNPASVQHLIELLQDNDEYVRRGVVEVLHAVGNAETVKDLLLALKDNDWWVRARTTDALSAIGGSHVADAARALLHDADPAIRRNAIEILNTTQDLQTFDSLVEALDDEDWWVQERAIDALSSLADPRAVPALLPIAQQGTAQARAAAIKALASFGDHSIIEPLLPLLQHANKGVRHETLHALSVLVDETHANTVLQAVTHMPQQTDEAMQELAQNVITTIRTKWEKSLSAPPATSPVETPHPASSHSAVPAQGSDIIDATALEPGAVLDQRYRVIRQIGQGGFGTVVLVEDSMVKEQLILKFINPQLAADEQTIARFLHEMRLARRISHPNVIRIHDLFIFGRSPAISMEYFPGHSLSDELRSQQPLPLRHGLKVVWDICCGMHAAHHAEVVHRDLKPSNILIDDEGHVKIVDFGLAAASSHLSERMTKTGAMMGTPLYMPPEQVLNRDIDQRADIYSLGIIMYEICTGLPPYLGDSPMSILFQHTEGKPIPPQEKNPAIPPALGAMILKAMAVKREDRFQSMEELGMHIVELTKAPRK